MVNVPDRALFNKLPLADLPDGHREEGHDLQEVEN